MGCLHTKHDPSVHIVAKLDSSLDLSLFDDAHWPFASFLVVNSIKGGVGRSLALVMSIKGSIMIEILQKKKNHK